MEKNPAGGETSGAWKRGIKELTQTDAEAIKRAKRTRPRGSQYGSSGPVAPSSDSRPIAGAAERVSGAWSGMAGAKAHGIAASDNILMRKRSPTLEMHRLKWPLLLICREQ